MALVISVYGAGQAEPGGTYEAGRKKKFRSYIAWFLKKHKNAYRRSLKIPNENIRIARK